MLPSTMILALIYNQPRIPFDGNVKRVFLRLFNVKSEKNENKVKKIINKKFNTNRNGDLAEALMEFGAIICKPSNPMCNICNLKKNCYFFKNKTPVLANNKHYIFSLFLDVYC